MIKDEFNLSNLNSFILNIIENENKDVIIEDNNIIYQLTTLYNQKNNIYNNLSTVYLGKCETKL